MDPAKTVIEKIGGAEAAARITGKYVSSVYRWMYPTARGGTGGVIPHAAAVKLLKHARENSIPLRADDFNPLLVDDFTQTKAEAESAA